MNAPPRRARSVYRVRISVLAIPSDRFGAWLRCGLTALWLCLGAMASSHAMTLFSTEGVSQSVRLTQNVQVLRDVGAAVPASEVLAGRHDAAFERMGPAALACAEGTVCWVRMTLSRSADAPVAWWLRARAIRPGSVQLYAAESTQAAAAPTEARQFPLNWRFVSSDLFFPLSLQLSPATFYLRIEDTQTADGFSVLQDSGLERQQRRLSTYLGISAGASFVLLVLNLVFWYWLRDRLFLCFALVALSAVLLHAWQIVPSLSTPERMGDLSLREGLQALFQAASALFVARLFELRRHFPWAARTTVIYAALNVLVGAIALTGEPAAMEPWATLFELSALAATIGMAGWLVFARRQWQYAWSAALVLVPVLSSLVGRLRWMGVLDAGPDEGLGPTWVAVRLTYMLLLSIVVADRTRRAEIQWRRSAELRRVNARLAEEVGRRALAEAGLEAALASERKASQQQRQFVSLVSHEFRTPLAVIDAAAQSIALPGVVVPPRIAKIRRAVQRLTTLVGNCLALDRMHADSTVLRVETVNLVAVVEGLSSPFGPADQARIRVETAMEPAWVSADPGLLDIALHNLVQNAIKYSPADREVHIRLVRQHPTVCIEVEDQGDGISESEQIKIFGRFVRGSNTGDSSGSGLGLFLGEEIARAHGGALVLLRSDARGSVFQLSLPIAIDVHGSTPCTATPVRGLP